MTNTEKRDLAKKNIVDFINKNSYLDLDGTLKEEYKYKSNLFFSTRSNGNVGDEEYGEEDYCHAIKIKKTLMELFSEDIEDIEIETVDEWVHLTVNLKIIVTETPKN